MYMYNVHVQSCTILYIINVFHYTVVKFISLIFSSSNAGFILESKGIPVIFQKKDKIRAKKMLRKGKRGQNIWKFKQKCKKL